MDLVETSDVSDDDAEMQWALDASLSSYTQEQPVSDEYAYSFSLQNTFPISISVAQKGI